MLKILKIAIILLVALQLHAQSPQSAWVDSVYNAMSTEQKVGQLFMVRAYSKSDNADVKSIEQKIKDYHIGGICFFQGDPTHQASLVNKYQTKSKTPLLIAIDGEWGLGMRYKEKAISFPRQLMLGAIQDNNMIYEMGREVASHLKRIGIHVNFAPVVDVNNNPKNPVINDRSFGEDKYNVIAKSYAYMKGMQDMGVMACMKHFPGHGDTDVDSHYGLPVISHSRDRLDSIELLPFKSLIKQGIASAMVAHLHIPAIDDRANRPTTLSQAAITGILKDEMGFTGLVYTDAMDMKGVSNHFPDGTADVEAFLAGADVILLPNDLAKGVEEIKKNLSSGVISSSRLEYSVKKILRAKYAVGLANVQSISLNGISDYVNSKRSLALKERLTEQAITLAKDDHNLVPVTNIGDTDIATIAIGASKTTSFQMAISKYCKATHHSTAKNMSANNSTTLLKAVERAGTVIATFNNMSSSAAKNFGIDTSSFVLLRELDKKKKLIVVVHGNPYALQYFDGFGTVVVTYDDHEVTQSIAAQSILGANTIKGRLPVSSTDYYRSGVGVYRETLGRLGYSTPERVGMSSSILSKMDDLAAEMISKKAAPGGQVFVAKDGKIVWEKAYGYHTYKKERAVKTTDLYDMASITKVCASTISLMQLQDRSKFDLSASLMRYLPSEVDTCDKRDLNVRSMLAHHAQLAGWIPFYSKTVSKSKKNPKPLEKYYRTTQQGDYNIQVANDMYMRADYRDSIWSRIYGSELKEKKGYKYSDLSFYMFHKIIEKQTGQQLQHYTFENFYRPLGLVRTGFLPLERHNRYDIAPTEEDSYFRQQRLQGHVHDMGAAMFGGVAGHAGLFSTASEIGVILQMLLNEGTYGGRQYITPETIKTYTTRYHASTRRGLGFDMKELDSSKNYLNVSEMASASAFGHLGFTGISAYADPEYDLVFVFVTNRTYPSMNNKKFAKDNYRPRMQTIAYQSMMDHVAMP